MPDNQDIMENIHTLCLEYREHLRSSDQSADCMTVKKMAIINRLLLSNSIHDLLSILSSQEGDEDCGALLSKHRRNGLPFLIKGFLIFVTFPASLPILILWSWIKRGTPDFSKVSGAILVDNIVSLCKDHGDLNRSSTNTILTIKSVLRSNAVYNTSRLKQTATEHSQGPAVHLNRASDQEDRGLIAMNDAVGGIFNAFFKDPEALDQSILDEDTGRPFIIASRIRPSHPEDDTFLLDIFCHFQYTLQAPMVITISVFKNVTPVPFRLGPLEFGRAHWTTAQTSRTYLYSCAQHFCPYFFEPTFEKLFHEARIHDEEIRGGSTDRRNAYIRALDSATTSVDRIRVLECLVNLTEKEHGYVYRDYLAYCSMSPDAEYQARYADARTHATKKIEGYIAQLPENYRTITFSALQIQGQFNRICMLLQNNNVGQAWAIYRTMPALSPFIKRTFPDITAMWNQLYAVFHMIDTDGYTLRNQCQNRVPDDQTVREDQLNSLFLYLKQDIIWCAVKTKSGKVDRFIIEAQALGRHAQAIRNTIYHRRMLTDEQDTQLYISTSQRGYYPNNQEARLNGSIQDALRYFRNMDALMTSYHPAYSARLQSDTIDPLQRLLESGEQAKKMTSHAMRLSIAKPIWEENGRRRVHGLKKDRSVLDASQWDELLAQQTSRVTYGLY